MGASSQAGGEPASTEDAPVDVDVDHVDAVADEGDLGDDGNDKQLDPPWQDDEPDEQLDAGDPVAPTTEPTGDVFNAFDASTWDISPTAIPWYETKRAMATTVVAAVATVTLVVSVVLLAVRGSSTADQPALVEKTSSASSPAPAAPPASVLTAAVPPPPPGPPPPPPDPPPPTYVPAARPSGNSHRAPSTASATRTSSAPSTRVTVKAPPARSPTP